MERWQDGTRSPVLVVSLANFVYTNIEIVDFEFFWSSHIPAIFFCLGALFPQSDEIILLDPDISESEVFQNTACRLHFIISLIFR